MLIQDGAAAVTNPYDIINNTGYTAYDSVRNSYAMSAAENVSYNTEKAHKKDYPDLSDDESSVLNLIRSGINQFDEIAMNSDLDVSSVGYALTMLEFKGIIKQKFGKVYEET